MDIKEFEKEIRKQRSESIKKLVPSIRKNLLITSCITLTFSFCVNSQFPISTFFAPLSFGALCLIPAYLIFMITTSLKKEIKDSTTLWTIASFSCVGNFFILLGLGLLSDIRLVLGSIIAMIILTITTLICRHNSVKDEKELTKFFVIMNTLEKDIDDNLAELAKMIEESKKEKNKN